jgi:ribosomal protein L11 methyltransferase
VTGYSKTWIEAQLTVAGSQAPQVESLMASLGALSITLTDNADVPVLEPGVGETPLWPDVVVTGLFDSNIDRDQLYAALSRAPGVGKTPQVGISVLGDRDWEQASLEDLEPMLFGSGFWVVPGAHEAPAHAETVLRLDPGLAFGSGTHPTTGLCLQWVAAAELKGLAVTDFGCGSGILGIAAALKGAASVLCIDNDPQALLATMENGARNGVESGLSVCGPGPLENTGSDVILANILAGTLIELAPDLCAALKPEGIMVLSGILQEQSDDVESAYRPWLEEIQVVSHEGWVMISGKRKEQ